MKLRKLHIEDYKMFKDFDISFVDENDKALPIIVLAGVNGSGKTTLLEIITNFIKIIKKNNQSYIEIEKFDTKGHKDEILILTHKDFLDIKESKAFKSFLSSGAFNPYDKINGDSLFPYAEYMKIDKCIYFSTNTSIEKLKKLIPEYLRKMVWNEDIKASEAFERIRDFINNIFKDINIKIEFDSRDGEENLFFRNKSGGDKFSIDALSTGEKTLLSKVLFLYLEDIKDKVILIDEPELSLHPSWQNKVLKIYENYALKNNCQIIIATHSPHIIGSAKNEYLRLLKKEDNKIVAIENIDRSYGLEFDKILTDIMGVENVRTPAVAKEIKRLWELLEDEDYECEEYVTLYNELETLLGSLDKDMVLSRLEIARIKSQNVKSK